MQLSRVAEQLNHYLIYVMRQPAGATIGYTNCIVATATLLVILPLLIIYLFAQKGFVESLSSSGLKM